MSKYFVDAPPVPVYEFEPGTMYDEQGQQVRPNVIYIKARMDMKTDAMVKGESFRMGRTKDAKGKEIVTGEVEILFGMSQLAMLKHNIVRWEGPDLDGVPCDAEHIGMLPPSDPFIDRVLDEISTRNQRFESPNPKSDAEHTSLKPIAPDSEDDGNITTTLAMMNGTSISPS